MLNMKSAIANNHTLVLKLSISILITSEVCALENAFPKSERKRHSKKSFQRLNKDFRFSSG